MKLSAAAPNSHRRLVIELDESAGYYLYVFENEQSVFDYLQDTLDAAKEQALEQFNVPKNAWALID